MHALNGMGLGMGYSWIIGLAIIIGLLWLFSKTFQNKNSQFFASKSALEILNGRLTKGEINKEEYESLKKTIS